MKVYNIDQEKELLTELIKELEERIEKTKNREYGDLYMIGRGESLFDFKTHLQAKLSKLQITEKK